MASFVNALQGRPDESLTSARTALESHLLAFAADEARLFDRVVHMPDFRAFAEAEARSIFGA